MKLPVSEPVREVNPVTIVIIGTGVIQLKVTEAAVDLITDGSWAVFEW